jgi:hypothetical protein
VLRVLLTNDDNSAESDVLVLARALDVLRGELGLEVTIEEAQDLLPGSESTATINVEAALIEAFPKLVEHLLRSGNLPLQDADRWLMLHLTERRLLSSHGSLFGATDWVDSERTWGSLISTHWLRAESGAQRERLLFRLVVHELGHVLGLVPEDREQTEQRYGTHCVNDCVMRQGESVQDFLRFIKEAEGSKSMFCELCSAFVRQTLHDV